jgi:hypothetical protein
MRNRDPEISAYAPTCSQAAVTTISDAFGRKSSPKPLGMVQGRSDIKAQAWPD